MYLEIVNCFYIAVILTRMGAPKFFGFLVETAHSTLVVGVRSRKLIVHCSTVEAVYNATLDWLIPSLSFYFSNPIGG